MKNAKKLVDHNLDIFFIWCLQILVSYLKETKWMAPTYAAVFRLFGNS